MKTTTLNLTKKLSLVILSTCLSAALLAPSAALARNNLFPTEPTGTSRPAATSTTSAPLARARSQAGAEQSPQRVSWWSMTWFRSVFGAK